MDNRPTDPRIQLIDAMIPPSWMLTAAYWMGLACAVAFIAVAALWVFLPTAKGP